MKVVNREELMRLPAGTIYTEYEPFNFGSIKIKGDTIITDGNDTDMYEVGTHIDWWEDELINLGCSNDQEEAMEKFEKGEDAEMYFEFPCRNGFYDYDQLYAVWSMDDTNNMIERLIKARGMINECSKE